MRTTKARISLRIRAFVISAFAVRCLDIIIPIDVISKITKMFIKNQGSTTITNRSQPRNQEEEKNDKN